MRTEEKQNETAALNMEVPAMLLEQFDVWAKQNMFANRSEAIRFIMRQAINQEAQQHPASRQGGNKS
jgi:metal-responsive CopG/Arc/MetJ family transcriptional regulator